MKTSYQQRSKTRSPTYYHFHFVTPQNFTTLFQLLREGHIEDFRSDLDVKLAEVV